MRKKLLRLLSLTLVVTLLPMLAACNRPQVNDSDNTENSGQSETESESTVDVPKPEEGPEAIHLLNKYVTASSSTDMYEYYMRPVDYRLSAPGLSEDSKEKYPKLDEFFEKLEEDTFSEVKENMENYNRNFYSDIASGGDINRRYYEYSDLRVMRADSAVVSLVYEMSSYMGGAHGFNAWGTVNCNPNTGERISVFDVIEDEAAFYEAVNKGLEENYPDIYEEFTKIEEYIPNQDERELTWSINNEGVTMFFGPFSLGAGALGSQVVTVDFENHEGLFKEEYTKTRNSYFFPVSNLMPAYIDRDGDGVRENLYLYLHESEDDYGELELFVNGERYNYECGYNTPDCYVLCLDGKYYFYYTASYENDYKVIKIVDLSTMEEVNGAHGGDLATRDYEWENYVDKETGYEVYISTREMYALTDPEFMRLSAHKDVLGTWSSIGDYHLAAGSPVPENTNGMYYRDDLNAMEALRDVACKLVKVDGTVIGDAVVTKGSFVVMKRTDGETFADFQLVDKEDVTVENYGDWSSVYMEEPHEFDEDEDIFRVVIENIPDEYFMKVDGDPESEVFSGIIYAG